MTTQLPPPVADPASTSFPLPRILTHPSSAPAELITQGAEGRLYKTTYLTPSLPAALKYRPSKPYRHPTLDARLTRQRIVAEARVLQRCRREGVTVPAVYFVDGDAGCLMMEWIEGAPVRARLNEWLKIQKEKGTDEATMGQDQDLLSLLRKVGQTIGGLHRLGVVHGDLTTSNLMLRPLAADAVNGDAPRASVLSGDVVVIDFGLATQSEYAEDKAVDLYVLERAFMSTHPQAENLFFHVLDAYKASYKQAGPVLTRLEDVRMRGRKRSMVG